MTSELGGVAMGCGLGMQGERKMFICIVYVSFRESLACMCIRVLCVLIKVCTCTYIAHYVHVHSLHVLLVICISNF